MKEIEQNDVDISELFKWGSKVQIVDENGNKVTDVYVRLVGDAEVNRSRVYALRRSAEMRKKLYDEGSDENLAFIPDGNLIPKDMLIESALIQWTKEYAQQAVRELKFNLPVEPGSSASLEEQEKYQQEIDNWPKNREEKIKEFITKKLENKKKDLESMPKDLIYLEYKRMLINTICEDEMLKAYRDMCTYFGCYKDEQFKEKLFNSVEEFNNLKSLVKNQLLGFYMSLEMDGENLKKSLEATQ